MTQNYPKRLIEVDLPIARISAHARREKSIRHGHISTLHIWWARRPLAACRAVICAALWPDPADVTQADVDRAAADGRQLQLNTCPPAFRQAAVKLLVEFAKRVYPTRINEEGKLLQDSVSPESLAQWEAIAKGTMTLDPDDPAEGKKVRLCLLDFIADFANWDNSTVSAYLETSRALTQAAHEALGGAPGTRPLVVDPFCGGGSIPLEALRVGADAFASDLNPIPVLLNKVVLEYIPKYGKRLADEVRKWGAWIKEQAEKELAEFYPKDPDGAIPIAYLWARTITCEGPACGAEVPLINSLWLGKKPHNSWAFRLVPKHIDRRVDFEVVRGAKPNEVGQGTVRRGSAICLCCGYTTPVARIRSQLAAREGGTSTGRLFCVVTKRPNEHGRFYRVANESDLNAVASAIAVLKNKESSNSLPFRLVPDESLPPQGTLGFRVQLYGMTQWGHLFLPRQSLVLTTLNQKVREVRSHLEKLNDSGFAEAVQAILALNVDKMADYGSSLASWSSPASQETVRGTFSRQALAMVWDFAEAYPFVSSSGGWSHNLEFLLSPLEAESRCGSVTGHIERASATTHPLPDDATDAFVTDPPYYDAIPYADLSDYFIVWLKRSLENHAMCKNFASLSPKDEECVVDTTKGHDAVFFETTMRQALIEGRRVTKPGGIGVLVFAHKSTAGWEVQLQAMVDAGWVITGSWPIDTERVGRVRANSSAALASSVHLVCRPRENANGTLTEFVGEWRDVLAELPKRIHEWMPRLAAEGVVGADAIFACLGPALEIFSRYSHVEKANGETAKLREYLEHVWAAVSTEALSVIFKDANAAGLEPDARLTAMWLWTIGGGGTNGNGKHTSSQGVEESPEDEAADEESSGTAEKGKGATGFLLEYDAARKIAQGLGVHLEQCDSLVEVKGDKARLLPVAERTTYLFGKGTQAGQTSTRRKKKVQQKRLFAELDDAETAEAGWTGLKGPPPGATVLDRVHQSMILFAANRGELLKRFLVEDGVGKDDRFWKLADNLNKLYPPGTEERRWIEGVLARKKGLGL